MAVIVNEDFADFIAKISLDNPIDDYSSLMDDKMKADVIMPQEVYNECWRKISAATRQIIWKMLFDFENKLPQQVQWQRASELLSLHREDASFYQANEYNKWIVLVRDELLKRKMFDFWKNEIVEKELGPCWARDSDLFDDSEDPEPANFYKYAGCEAPWLKKKKENVTPDTKDFLNMAVLHKAIPKCAEKLKKICKETALQDYMNNICILEKSSPDDMEAFKQIFEEVRNMIWEILFGGSLLTDEYMAKGGQLLQAYRRDARTYCPFEYNDWIPKVKAEVIKRKYFTFWEEYVVYRKLGFCDVNEFYGNARDDTTFYNITED